MPVLHPKKKTEPYLTIPENILRRKIGAHVKLSDIFTADKIHECQDIIDQALADLLREMETELAGAGNAYIICVDDRAQAAKALEKVAAVAGSIKHRMESLDFAFGFRVAQSLCDYLCGALASSQDTLLIVCKHIAVLNIIIRDQVKGDGGIMGQEILGNLDTLIKKSRK